MWSDKYRQWVPAKIVGVAQTPRSYVVETSKGERYTRNRIHLRKTQAKFRTVQMEPGFL